MSKPRYDWWGYVKGMIRRYPQLKAEYEELHRQAMRVDYSGMPRGGGAHRATEDLALRALPASKQHEFDAATRYHGEFIRLVAANRGLFDPPEKMALKSQNNVLY